jgi:diguanylate cyclase (GGDEF)-like protein
MRYLRCMVWPADLSFRPIAEAKFLRWFTDYIAGKVRSAGWCTFGLVLIALFGDGPIGAVRDRAFGEEPALQFELIRSLVILPCTLAMLAVIYSRLYSRYYLRVASVVAPIYAIAFVGLDWLMQEQGYSLSAWMVLVMLSPYQLFFLPHRTAILTTHVTLIAYAAVSWISGAFDGQRQFDFAVMCAAVAIGGAGNYMLQKSTRRGYLDWRRLTHSAHRDSLTGLFNRRVFEEHAGRLWQQAGRTGTPVAIFMIDVDCFKLLNDSLGHQVGDQYLTRISSVLSGAARRPMDIVTRYGGEEFCIVLWEAERAAAEQVAARLHAQIRNLGLTHPASPVAPTVSVSIGIACVVPAADRSVNGAIQLADEALYDAKAQGRDRTVVRDKEYTALRTGVFRTAASN